VTSGAFAVVALPGKLSRTVNGAVAECANDPDETSKVACAGPTVVPERTSKSSLYPAPVWMSGSDHVSVGPATPSGSGCVVVTPVALNVAEPVA